MNHETAQDIFSEMTVMAKADEHLGMAYWEFLQLAVRYARLRADWKLTTAEERNEMNEARSRCHDAFIDACNILSRACAEKGQPILWREQLGQDRKELGNFACHIHCILGIMAR